MATHNVSIEKTCHWVLLLSTIIVAAAGLSACNTDPDRHEELGRVGWTLEEGAITLGEDLFLVGTDDFYFGRISDLDVNEEGRMYVGDSRDLRVKVLTSDGEFLRSIGRRGEGPEEFRSIFDVTVGRGDSLYVVDGEARRLSVYDQEGEFQYARSIDSDYGVPYKVLVPEQREGFLVAYTPSFCHSPEETDMHLSLRRVGPKGEVGGAVLEAPCKEKISRATDGAIQVLQKPFGRQPLIASAATESFFYGWTDSLAASRYDYDGELEQHFFVPTDPVPVSEESLEEVLSGWDEEMRDLMRKRARQTKPDFGQMLADDEGRLWFKRPTPNEERVIWWQVDLENRQIRTTTLPNRIDILQVRNGFVYARSQSEDGEPVLVRYVIQ